MARIQNIIIGSKKIYPMQGLINCSLRGSVSVTNNGIASGFTNSSNYILTNIGTTSIKNKPWEFNFRFMRDQGSYSSEFSLLQSSNSGNTYIFTGVTSNRFLLAVPGGGSNDGTDPVVTDLNVWYTANLKCNQETTHCKVYRENQLITEKDFVLSGDPLRTNSMSDNSYNFILCGDVDYSPESPGAGFYLDLLNTYFIIDNKRYDFFAEILEK